MRVVWGWLCPVLSVEPNPLGQEAVGTPGHGYPGWWPHTAREENYLQIHSYSFALHVALLADHYCIQCGTALAHSHHPHTLRIA